MTVESFAVESGARQHLRILPEAWKTRRRVPHISLDGPSAVHRLHRFNYWSLSQEWSKTGYDQQPRVGQKLNVGLGQFPSGASFLPSSFLGQYNDAMNTKDLLKELEELGSEKVRRQNNKQGAHENQFGVKLGDIRKVAKKAKKSNPLALELWETGNIDARMLAILLMEPKKLSNEDLLKLAGSIKFTRVSDWIDSYLLKNHPNKDEIREDWMNSPNPMVARSGWSITYQKIGESPDELDLKGILDRIENDLASSPPEVQWTMNFALTYIGIHSEKLRGRAIRIGESVGLYRDYPASKGCTSPYAPVWIEEMVSRKQQ